MNDQPQPGGRAVPPAASERPQRAASARDELLADGNMVIYRADTNQLLTLNPTAALVWSCCDGAHTLPAIVAEVRALFPDAPMVERDVNAIVQDFRTRGMLRPDEG